MVGSSIWNLLQKNGFKNLVGKSSFELDLRNQKEVQDFFKIESPEIVICAAAKVGGILANVNNPFRIISDNLDIQNNLIKSSLEHDVKKFIFLGSSCIYPKNCSQPIKESYLLTNTLEQTNQYYSVSKIAGIKLCESIRNQYKKDFVCLMPCNLYGPRDNFDLKNSHVLPALIRRFYEGKKNKASTICLWGTGTPLREFLYVEDLARAIFFMMNKKKSDFIYNVGSGIEITIRDLALKIQNIIGYEGEIIWDHSKPNGVHRKLLNTQKLSSLGWKSTFDLDEGINNTISWFNKNYKNLKKVTF